MWWMNEHSQRFVRAIEKKRAREDAQNDGEQAHACPNPACPTQFSSKTHMGIRTHVGRSVACKQYEAEQFLLINGNGDDPHGNFDNNQEPFFEHGGGIDLDPNGGGQDQQRCYEGPLPPFVEAHAEKNKNSRQYDEVINKSVNPPERSQAYIQIQLALIKEVYGDDPKVLAAIIEGNMGSLIEIVANSAPSPKEEAFGIIHSFMEGANLSGGVVEDH